MTGSPVFKVNLNTSKKQKIQRKLNFVRDVPKNLLQLHVDNLKSDDSEPDTKTQDLSKRNTKSINSSLSSFVFANKRGVKRKLDFDADNGSDTRSSFRFSSRNISLCGLQSKNSSLIDVKSITFSPNKNRFRGSYSRSSATSTCRRRLFADDEPTLKKAKLESPVIGINSNSKKKEVKLSLKKKFPGVPNSDAARSGLLLNLAFSKYNLSTNAKNEGVSLGFVGDTGLTAKKDYVHYSSIKKDDNSHTHSPVFMAIKKVKRKLNLEEQDSSRSLIKVTSPIPGKTTAEKHVPDINAVSKNAVTESHEQKENQCETMESQQIDISVVERHLSASVVSDHNVHTTPTSRPKLIKSTYEAGHFESQKCSSPVLMKGHHGTLKQRNDLFKNSKLRSSLRNQIFNLSKGPNDAAKGGSASNTSSSPVLNKKSCQREHRRRSSDLKHLFNHSESKPAPKYDRILVKRDLTERTKRDSERLKRLANGTCANSQVRKKPQKWIDDSFSKEKNRSCPKISKPSLDSKPNSFIASHIQRFLRDCVEAMRLGIGADETPDTSATGNESVLAGVLDSSEKSDVKLIKKSVDESFKYAEKNHSQPAENLDLLPEMNLFENDTGHVPMEISDDLAEIAQSQKHSEGKCAELASRVIEPQDRTICAIENSQLKKVGRSKLSDFIIEDVDSQEIDNQCVEEVELVIVNANSESSSAVDDEDHRTDRTLLSQAKRFRIFEDTVDDDILNKTSTEKEVLFDNSSDGNPQDRGYQVEEISTPDSASNEDQFIEVQKAIATPKNDSLPDQEDIYDSAKKGRRRKIGSDTLVARLHKLLNREKSEARMWEYELSKRNSTNFQDTYQKSAVFCVEKMWKEFSRLVLLCSFVNQDTPDKLYDLDEMKNFGVAISNLVVIVMEPEFCPKALTYSSVFLVHPPWRILYSERSDPLILFRPCKVEIISENGKPLFYKDPTIPNCPEVVGEYHYCTCCDVSCDCILPEGYQTVIQHLLLPNTFDSLDWSNYSRLENYNAEDFKSTTRISDVVLKHKLYSTECLYLDLRILHVHKYQTCSGEITFYHIICIDEKQEICCVVVGDKVKRNLSSIDAEIMFRFSGILPWKVIPSKSVPSFIEHLELNGASNILEKTHDRSVYVFVLSEKYGNMERLT